MHKLSKYTLTNENIGTYEEIFENLRIIDCHTHLGHDKDGSYLSAEKYMAAMKGSNISRSIVFPLNDPNQGNNFHNSNNEIYRLYKDNVNHVVPFFRLDPKKDWKKEFDLRLSQGFKGIKLHSRSQKFGLNSPKLYSLMDACQQNGLMVLFHTGLGVINVAAPLAEVARRYPQIRIILGHSGFVDLDNAIAKLSKYPNFLYDTSSLTLFDLYELLRKVSYKKIVFGSDIPYFSIDIAMQGTVDCAIAARKTPSQIRKILGGNIATWLK